VKWLPRHEVPPAYLHRLSEREDRSRSLTAEHFHLAAEAIRRDIRRARIYLTLMVVLALGLLIAGIVFVTAID
jgi:hypothetical protein